MSNLKTLARQVSRELAGFGIAATVELADASGTQTVSNGVAPLPGRRFTTERYRRALSRIMAGAHAGATIRITFPDDGSAVDLVAPGGAFDDRPATPAAVIPASPESPSADCRPVTPGVRLASSTRGLFVGTAGDVSVVMAGNPDGAPVTFQGVPAGFLLPVQVVEIDPETTATGLVGMF